jgi:hypothetical protein
LPWQFPSQYPPLQELQSNTGVVGIGKEDVGVTTPVGVGEGFGYKVGVGGTLVGT